MGMNSELHGDDKIRHDEASTLQKIYMTVTSARNDAVQIFEHSNDYRARAMVDNLSNALIEIEKLELEIVNGLHAMKDHIADVK